MRSVAWIVAAGIAWKACLHAAAPDAPAAWPVERTIRFLEARVAADGEDIVALNRLADLYLEQLRESGNLDHLRRAGDAAGKSLVALPAEQNVDALRLRARVKYQSHQFAAARDDAARVVELAPRKAASHQVLGDALLELGEYSRAAEVYREMERLDSASVETRARLARLAHLHGRTDEARKHLEAALAEAGKSTPGTAAWCEVQLGQLEFGRGNWDEAEKHYQAALKLRPDRYVALDHAAELKAARGNYDEALVAYRQIVERVPRPELWQALGDVYVFAGKLPEAKPWHDRALAEYLKSGKEGHAYYIHHLSSFYADVQANPAEALRWAREDFAMRQSVHACDALAWALYRNGEFAEAIPMIEKALALGTRDANLVFHAAMIHLGAGQVEKGRELLRKTAEINPRYNAFHVHR